MTREAPPAAVARRVIIDKYSGVKKNRLHANNGSIAKFSLGRGAILLTGVVLYAAAASPGFSDSFRIRQNSQPTTTRLSAFHRTPSRNAIR